MENDGAAEDAPFPSINLDDADPEPDIGFLPPGCDLFPNFDPDAITAMREAGRAPTSVRIMRFQNGQRITIAGTWPVDVATTQWLLGMFGPGVYDVQCLDQHNTFMKQRRHNLQAAPPAAAAQQAQAPGAPPGFGYGPPPGYPPPGYPAYPQAQPWGYPQPPPQKSEGDQLDKLIKVLTLKMAADSSEVKNHIALATMQQKNGGDGDSKFMFELVKDALRAKTKEAGNGNGLQVADFVALLKLGGQLAGPGGDEDDWWKEFVPDFANSVGPGALAVLASATLKEDKAQQVLDLMEKHIKEKAAADAKGDAE